jgi:hypothetical protein
LIQAWAPLAGGKLFKPNAEADPALSKMAQLVGQLAEAKQTSREAIVLAWLLRHPAGIQPIMGSTKPERIATCALADEVALTREEWYSNGYWIPLLYPLEEFFFFLFKLFNSVAYPSSVTLRKLLPLLNSRTNLW